MEASMTTLEDLTDVQGRILRTARDCDKATFNGKQRMSIDRLHALGLSSGKSCSSPADPRRAVTTRSPW
jgi:hypothetical protein